MTEPDIKENQDGNEERVEETDAESGGAGAF